MGDMLHEREKPATTFNFPTAKSNLGSPLTMMEQEKIKLGYTTSPGCHPLFLVPITHAISRNENLELVKR